MKTAARIVFCLLAGWGADSVALAMGADALQIAFIGFCVTASAMIVTGYLDFSL